MVPSLPTPITEAPVAANELPLYVPPASLTVTTGVAWLTVSGSLAGVNSLTEEVW